MDARLKPSLDMKMRKVEVENDVGRMGHHLWGTHRDRKPRNALCSHHTIQHLLSTLCHLHPFVRDHLGELPLSETDDELQTRSEWAVCCPFVSLARADVWGLSAAGLAVHSLPSASLTQGRRENGRSPAGAQ